MYALFKNGPFWEIENKIYENLQEKKNGKNYISTLFSFILLHKILVFDVDLFPRI